MFISRNIRISKGVSAGFLVSIYLGVYCGCAENVGSDQEVGSRSVLVSIGVSIRAGLKGEIKGVQMLKIKTKLRSNFTFLGNVTDKLIV